MNFRLFHLQEVPEEIGEIRNRPQTDPGHGGSEETDCQQGVSLLIFWFFSVVFVLHSVV